jgi:hypothetical protein
MKRWLPSTLKTPDVIFPDPILLKVTLILAFVTIGTLIFFKVWYLFVDLNDISFSFACFRTFFEVGIFFYSMLQSQGLPGLLHVAVFQSHSPLNGIQH